MHAVARLCERPGCSDRAEVAYGFDAAHLVVWLDAFHVAQGARSGVLCRRHANAMVVPLNWMLDDRRDPEPRLFSAPPAPVVADVAPARRRRSAPAQQAEQLRLDTVDSGGTVDSGDTVDSGGSVDTGDTVTDEAAAVEPAPTARPEVAAAEQPVAPWVPQFDQNDDLKGLLNARGRLLSRAFNGTGSHGDD